MSEIENKPLAIFICGPTAAGKSSTIRYLKEKSQKEGNENFRQGTVMDFDIYFKEELDKIILANKKLTQPLDLSNPVIFQKLMDVADKNAQDKRNTIFDNCIKNKCDFTFENTMPEHAFQRMKIAKEAGFKVITHITFQNNLNKHIDSEKTRRDAGVEIGATFRDDAHAIDVVTGTYKRCLKGIQKSMAYGDVKVYINYMKPGPPEENIPVCVAEKNFSSNYKLKVNKEITNKDLKSEIGNILVNQQINDKNKGKNKDKGNEI